MLPVWETWCQAPSLWDFCGERGSLPHAGELLGFLVVPRVFLYELALGKIVFMLMASMVTEKKTNRSEELAVQGSKPQLSLLETLCTAMKSPAAGSFWKYSCSNALTSSSVLLFRL